MSVFLASSLCLAFCRNSGSLSGAHVAVQQKLQGAGVWCCSGSGLQVVHRESSCLCHCCILGPCQGLKSRPLAAQLLLLLLGNVMRP